MENEHNSRGTEYQNQGNRNFRNRRSSSSLISSTTSSSSPLSQQLARSAATMNRSYSSFLNNNTRGGEEDELQPSSSTPSFSTGSRGQRGRNVGNQRSSSPLGSPDSTYWSPSSVSNSNQHRRESSRTSSSSSTVVQDPCVVSSSTMDDIPPSPFSPEETHGHQNHIPHPPRAPSPVMPPPPPIIQVHSSPGLDNGSVAAISVCVNGTNDGERGQNHPAREASHPHHQPLNITASSSSSASATSISFSSSSFNISPLRNKIKKASSFERFSAQAQAISNSSAAANHLNSVTTNEHNLPSNLPGSNSSIINTNSGSTVPLRSWESNYGASGSKSTFVSSLHDSVSVLTSGTKPYHIKKVVARLANAMELERIEAEAAAALAAANEEINSRHGPEGLSNNSMGIDIVDGGGKGSGNNPDIPPDSLIRRQLSRSPLNFAERSGSGTGNTFNEPSLPIASRNPVISTKTFNSKKMPLTPKQKLLHRMQSGEITIPMSTTPPPQIQQPHHQAPVNISSPPHQQQPSPAPPPCEHPPHPNQILLNAFQPQHHHLLMQDSLQHPNGSGMMDEGSGSPTNDRYGNVMNNYEAFIRSTAGEDFTDSMPKETNDSGNGQILYDPADAYNYYYGNILTDEIFNSNNSVDGGNVPSGSRIIHSSMIHSGMEEDGSQFQGTSVHNSNGQLEFILGLPPHERSVGREDLMHLGNGEEMQIQQQQFLDPNEMGFVGGKSSQLAEISTLRNLLMMEPLARTQHHDESWISAAAAEYQNRMSSSNLRISGNSNSTIPGSNSTGSTGVLSGGNNSWVSEWAPRGWQGQGQPHDEGEQDEQNEVMDMSVMEIEKTHHNTHSIIKRTLQHSHPSSLGGPHNGMAIEEVDLVSERDLANGVPLMPLPMDLQQSFVNNGKPQIMSNPSALIMNPQHHHHRNVILEYDDEPVNLMSAVNLEQALVHHHSHAGGQDTQNLPQTSPTIVGDLTNATYGNVCVGSNIIFTTTSTTSTTVATANYDTTHSPPPFQPPPPHQPLLELLPTQETNMDEKRIIRVKRKKDNSDDSQTENLIEKKPNLIPDKPVQPKSFASLPSLLTLRRMNGNGWGVVTNRNKRISANARFGPVEGPLKRASKADLENSDAVYPVLVMVDSGGIVYQLDRMDDDLCNWMKFVRRARSGQEQNVLVSEEDGLLYFTTCRDIPSKTELQIGYGLEYAQKYNLPYFEAEVKEESHNENQCNNKAGGGSRKVKRKAPPVVEIEKFLCFECDMNCGSLEELNKHLDTIHEDVDGFRRPKKKAIRKFYNAMNNNSKAKEDADAKVTGDAEAESTCYTSKRSLKKKEIERLRKEQEEIPVVESSSPDVDRDLLDDLLGEEDLHPVSQQQEASSSSTLPTPLKIKCSLCYKVFATQHRLQKHMFVHSADHLKPLKCDLCAKRFLTNSALAGHLKSHDGKCFECPLCKFSTQQLLQLKEHVQSHKKESGFSCPHCPKTFSCYSLVRKHIRAFHGPRLFSCDVCCMKFPTPDKLKLHELRHSTFRAYLCAECGRQFKRKDKLTDHTKKAHGKLKGQITRILPAEPSIPVVVQSKPKGSNKKILPRLSEEELSKFTFRCQGCMIGFRRRGMLVNHLAKRHPDMDTRTIPELSLPITRTAKNYFCPHCERVYKSSSKRKSHILKNHPGKAVPPQVRGKDLKTILEEKVGSTTLDPLNLNDIEGEMEQIKVTVNEVLRKETVVGEIVGTPHSCTWCHREYATRAKLLQHQRKFHIELMPLEIQTPRPQKNNVRPLMDGMDVGSNHGVDDMEGPTDQDFEEEDLVEENSPIGMEGSSEKQLVIQQQPSQENMFGYLITTSGHVTNNEIETLLQMSLLSQNTVTSGTQSSSNSNSGSRTITLCIPPGIISSNSHSISSTNPTAPQLISTGINVNGTQILTKTD